MIKNASLWMHNDSETISYSCEYLLVEVKGKNAFVERLLKNEKTWKRLIVKQNFYSKSEIKN